MRTSDNTQTYTVCARVGSKIKGPMELMRLHAYQGKQCRSLRIEM